MNSYGKSGCKDAVWKKGKIIRGYDSNEWRKDIYGNMIRYIDHGKATEYGWDIDHYIPKSKGGSDDITNLHPVQYSKNRGMGIRMNDKDKRIWFDALEKKQNIQYSEKTNHFKYNIGEIVLVKQTPISHAEPAIIQSLDIKNKKVAVKWIFSGYSEKVEMYHRLFSEIPKIRRHI
jgi:hypothetical protein